MLALLRVTVMLIAIVSPGPAVAQPGNATRGLALLTNFRDSLPANSGNALRCVSCHLENGTRGRAMPWTGSSSRYPRFRSRPGYDETIEQRINECVARSLAGRMLREDSREMRDMVAYIATLDALPRADRVDTVKLVGSAPRGRSGYAKSCARCHGDAGQGLRAVAPAVWGGGSFSIGAGMARQYTLATFLKHNMPFDGSDTLSAQRAADIAAYVLSRARQDHPGKERDWPRGDPPADVAYATTAARRAGKPMPPPRPLLRRRVSPDSLTQ
ncbi:c-type cytochrome [Gemmatimonas sp.]|uniref:c-type cytochrome n=1 Tax=Gemmatimonas sp. TaxID=1962908 RepID=UPI0027B88BB7|nr:c-type cytochrome [Gemmatimonas sp.]